MSLPFIRSAPGGLKADVIYEIVILFDVWSKPIGKKYWTI